MKKVAGKIKGELAQYREMAAFRAVRLRSRCVDAAPAQPRLAPDRTPEAAAVLAAEDEEQVVVIWAGTNGYLDALPVAKVRAFEDGLLSLLRGKNVDILNTIRDSRDLADDTAAKLKAVVEGYAKTFA